MNEYIDKLEAENESLKKWVNDLQSGMYINCVYCGHRYGPREGTPVSMADVLKEHIEKCPQHPMSKLKERIVELEATHSETETVLNNYIAKFGECGECHELPK